MVHGMEERVLIRQDTPLSRYPQYFPRLLLVFPAVTPPLSLVESHRRQYQSRGLLLGYLIPCVFPQEEHKVGDGVSDKSCKLNCPEFQFPLVHLVFGRILLKISDVYELVDKRVPHLPKLLVVVTMSHIE